MEHNQRRFTVLIGIILIVVGALSLSSNLIGPLFGWNRWWWVPWRIWPLLVIGLGLAFVLTPFTVSRRRGLGALFIPGVPVLVTGGLLLFSSLFNVWGTWAWLWPLEILGLALGFALAAMYMRNVWLLFPAIIIGANGLLFQLCAITGRWEMWAVLWAVEPLSVGLGLLAVNVFKRRGGLLIAGIILCGVAAIAMLGMTALFPEWWLLNLLGPSVLIGVGLLLLLANVRPARRRSFVEG